MLVASERKQSRRHSHECCKWHLEKPVFEMVYTAAARKENRYRFEVILTTYVQLQKTNKKHSIAVRELQQCSRLESDTENLSNAVLDLKEQGPLQRARYGRQNAQTNTAGVHVEDLRRLAEAVTSHSSSDQSGSRFVFCSRYFANNFRFVRAAGQRERAKVQRSAVHLVQSLRSWSRAHTPPDSRHSVSP